MKPITEEQRQQLISLARIEISRWKLPSDKQYMVDLMGIALASLMADVEYNTSDENGEINLEVPKSKYDKCQPDYRWISYTAPPVPVIKLPDNNLIKEVFLSNGFKEKAQPDGAIDLNPYVYTAAKELVKRLNGLS